MPMRRVVTILCVFVVIGAIINAMAALACAALSRQRMFDARTLGRLRAEQYEREERLAKSGVTPPETYLSRVFVGPGTRLMVVEEDNQGQSLVREQQAAGWPMLALEAQQISGRRVQTTTKWGARMGTLDLEFPALPINAFPAAAPIGAATAPAVVAPPLTVSVAPRQKADHLLPLRPMWPGFAINTLAYAVAAWLLSLMFAIVMRTQRRLRHRCGHCAYPVGVSPVCTECGRRVGRSK